MFMWLDDGSRYKSLGYRDATRESVYPEKRVELGTQGHKAQCVFVFRIPSRTLKYPFVRDVTRARTHGFKRTFSLSFPPFKPHLFSPRFFRIVCVYTPLTPSTSFLLFQFLILSSHPYLYPVDILSNLSCEARALVYSFTLVK